MTFDLATLMAVGVLTTAVAGALALIAWIGDRNVRALPWWAAGYFVTALGIALLLVGRGRSDTAWIFFAVAFLSLGPSLAWAGARLLNDERPLLLAIIAGPLLAMAAWAAALLFGYPAISTATQFAVTSAYLVLTMVALLPQWRAGLRSAVALIGFVALHTAVFAVGLVEAMLNLLPDQGLLGFKVLFSVIHFEQLLFAMGSAIFLVALVRERSEMAHKIAAEIDTLTGLATRRAFMDRAERQFAPGVRRDAPLALMMFDLDRFKRINDEHGHAAGDEALRIFAQVARSRLRAADFMGRIGGEEFAVIMPGASLPVACSVANRIRESFAATALVIGGRSLRATVSGGVASAQRETTLEQLLSTADQALYRAKAQGRNRIERATRADRDENGTSVVIHVA